MMLRKGDKVKINPERSLGLGNNLDYIQSYIDDQATLDTIFTVSQDCKPEYEMIYIINQYGAEDSCYKRRFIKVEPVTVKLPEGLFTL